jgi:ATP-dependent DNA helicase PIF1
MKYIKTDQDKALEFMIESNCLLTGPPGSGKTYLIKKFVAWARQCGYKVAVTATTGCAAYLIEGQTINSWGKIGLGENSVMSLVSNIVKYGGGKQWKNIDVLIIDEISMMSKDLFVKLDLIGKIIRKSEAPFGGIHLICVGDFSQLAPVNGEFIFKSEIFEKCFEYGLYLNKVHRQKDVSFLKLLDEIRENKVSKKSMMLLTKIKEKKINEDDLIQPTILLPLNKDVDKINSDKLNKINGQEFKFVCRKLSYKVNNKAKEIREVQTLIDKYTNVSSIIKLKKGAQVMLLKNLQVDIGLVNGSLGIVRSINNDIVNIEFMNGIKMAITYEQFTVSNDEFEFTFEQIPLKCAWATSIHKSQGQSINCCLIDIGKSIFQPQQAYVALSRIIDPLPMQQKHNGGLYIADFHINSFKVYKEVIDFYDKFFELDIVLQQEYK